MRDAVPSLREGVREADVRRIAGDLRDEFSSFAGVILRVFLEDGVKRDTPAPLVRRE